MKHLESMVGEMTVGELCKRAGRGISEFVEAVFASDGAISSTTATTVPKAARRGGVALDKVLAALTSFGGPSKLEDVRAKVGGSVTQVRAALQKLASAKKVKITGQRRGTRYSVT